MTEAEVRKLIDDQVSDALLMLATAFDQRASNLFADVEKWRRAVVSQDITHDETRAQVYQDIGGELREVARRIYGG